MAKDEDRKTNSEPPRIYHIAKLKGPKNPARRNFIEKSLQTMAGASLLAIPGCADSELDVLKNSIGDCSCHVVCTSEGGEDNNYSSTFDSQYSGTVCTCDVVCTCDTVCTCNSEGGGGGGGSYWYPN